MEDVTKGDGIFNVTVSEISSNDLALFYLKNMNDEGPDTAFRFLVTFFCMLSFGIVVLLWYFDHQWLKSGVSSVFTISTTKSLHDRAAVSTYCCGTLTCRASSQAVSEHQEGVPSGWEVVLDSSEPLLKCQSQEESDKCVVSVLSSAPIGIRVVLRHLLEHFHSCA
jgi:hypothetical protein